MAFKMQFLYPLIFLLCPVSAYIGAYPVPINDASISIPNKQQISVLADPNVPPDRSTPSIDRQIQCDGLPPDLDIAPLLAGVDWREIPEEMTWGIRIQPLTSLALGNLREVCAKGAYGGSRGFDMGMWCDSKSGEVRSQNFISPQGKFAPLSVLLMTCHMRCRCVSAELRDAVPASVVLESEKTDNAETLYKPLQGIDRWRRTGDGQRVFEVDYAEEADSPSKFILMAQSPKHSSPNCRGTLPTWPLPAPLRAGDVTYSNIQELCAATWFDGHLKGNAGAVCETEADRTNLRFLDYMAHPLLENRNFPAGTLVAMWCQSHCRCNSTDPVVKPLPEVSFVRDAFVFTANFPRDSIALSVTGPFGTQSFTPESLDTSTGLASWASNFQTPGASSSGQSSPGSCSWSQASSSRQPECLTCRRRCTSNSDCQTRGGRNCKCVGTPLRKVPARWFGTCAVEALKGFRGAPGGRKREVERVNCVCNATYVSRSCCESNSGLVWEDRRLFLGSLEE